MTDTKAPIQATHDLEEVRKAVFGDVGDEPNVYADYDRCSELSGKMRRAIAALSAGQAQPVGENAKLVELIKTRFLGVHPDELDCYLEYDDWTRIISALSVPPEIEVGDKGDGYQERVSTAHHALFHDDPTDVEERRARFFEEANEACQALGMTREEAIQLVDYTYDRPVGEPAKEVGAAMLTLTSLCVVADLDLMACAEADLEKLQRPETIARIRAKRSTRHGRGPLPGFDAAPSASIEGETDV